MWTETGVRSERSGSHLQRRRQALDACWVKLRPGDAVAGRPCSDVSMGRGAVLSTAGRGESFHCLEH